ncbi:uncharacterized protein LOC134855574 [Symsagittifera roscoffensis]|uniref:uncharacterized protein LOC134855574 n=1 Tax=Symsagittifera roscoffensis TaxID=84072 RepID=UPI00307B15E7
MICVTLVLFCLRWQFVGATEVMGPMGVPDMWQSFLYVLPHDNSTMWQARTCAGFSKRYCFVGNLIRSRGHEDFEEAPDQHYIDFIKLLKPLYTLINWFSMSSLMPQEVGSCCFNQMTVYHKFGTKNGMSPIEYVHSVTNFSAEGKQLNLIHAQYNKFFCVNIIQGVGFGSGRMKFRGKIHNAVFVLTPNDNGLIHFFPPERIKEQLNYDWFKQNVICEEQSWICIRYPPRQLASNSSAST